MRSHESEMASAGLGQSRALADNDPWSSPVRVGRYMVYGEIASGGMASVHLGCLADATEPHFFAIKRLHPHLAREDGFVRMLLDEARITTLLRHPNVVRTVEVIQHDKDVLLVMEHAYGVPLSILMTRAANLGERMPEPIVTTVMTDVLLGLHFAHELADERGQALHVVHRDVSPQNVIVGVDGITRVLDFGIAKAMGRLQTTAQGQRKGKLGYMAPEQLSGSPIDRRCDIYLAGIVAWELLAGRRLFWDESREKTIRMLISHQVAPPSTVSGSARRFDHVVLRAVHREPHKRFGTALDAAQALRACVPSASAAVIAEWVHRIAGDMLDTRAKMLEQMRQDAAFPQTEVDADRF